LVVGLGGEGEMARVVGVALFGYSAGLFGWIGLGWAQMILVVRVAGGPKEILVLWFIPCDTEIQFGSGIM
jgi:hypothetical protein